MRGGSPPVRDLSKVGDRKKKLVVAGRREVGRKTEIKRERLE